MTHEHENEPEAGIYMPPERMSLKPISNSAHPLRAGAFLVMTQDGADKTYALNVEGLLQLARGCIAAAQIVLQSSIHDPGASVTRVTDSEIEQFYNKMENKDD